MDSNRMRKLFLFGAFILFMTGVSAQQDSLKYRISLKDKATTEYSLKCPEKFLSEKAIERRKKQNLPIDSTDLPVCRKYIDEIRKRFPERLLEIEMTRRVKPHSLVNQIRRIQIEKDYNIDFDMDSLVEATVAK